ncbi:MAG: hypothetical protein ACR2JQ_07500 [Mycobacteriales bacterium]
MLAPEHFAAAGAGGAGFVVGGVVGFRVAVGGVVVGGVVVGGVVVGGLVVGGVVVDGVLGGDAECVDVAVDLDGPANVPLPASVDPHATTASEPATVTMTKPIRRVISGMLSGRDGRRAAPPCGPITLHECSRW